MTNLAFRSRLPLAAALAAAVLSGCYVAPLYPQQPASTVVHVPAPVPSGPLTFSARLYPSNDAASVHGMVSAVVTNDLNGRGHFSTNIGGESFTGEATRVAGSPKDGVANGAGNRGGYINCKLSLIHI